MVHYHVPSFKNSFFDCTRGMCELWSNSSYPEPAPSSQCTHAHSPVLWTWAEAHFSEHRGCTRTEFVSHWNSWLVPKQAPWVGAVDPCTHFAAWDTSALHYFMHTLLIIQLIYVRHIIYVLKPNERAVKPLPNSPYLSNYQKFIRLGKSTVNPSIHTMPLCQMLIFECWCICLAKKNYF